MFKQLAFVSTSMHR